MRTIVRWSVFFAIASLLAMTSSSQTSTRMYEPIQLEQLNARLAEMCRTVEF